MTTIYNKETAKKHLLEQLAEVDADIKLFMNLPTEVVCEALKASADLEVENYKRAKAMMFKGKKYFEFKKASGMFEELGQRIDNLRMKKKCFERSLKLCEDNQLLYVGDMENVNYLIHDGEDDGLISPAGFNSYTDRVYIKPKNMTMCSGVASIPKPLHWHLRAVAV